MIILSNQIERKKPQAGWPPTCTSGRKIEREWYLNSTAISWKRLSTFLFISPLQPTAKMMLMLMLCKIHSYKTCFLPRVHSSLNSLYCESTSPCMWCILLTTKHIADSGKAWAGASDNPRTLFNLHVLLHHDALLLWRRSGNLALLVNTYSLDAAE